MRSPLYFDPANEVANCVLVLGVHAKHHSQPARDLINKFHWAQIEYTKRPKDLIPKPGSCRSAPASVSDNATNQDLGR